MLAELFTAFDTYDLWLAVIGLAILAAAILPKKGWNTTWRLLGVAMILTIALTAFLGWWLASFLPVTAVLFGAVIAPTDPVLASEVQVGAPGEGIPEEEAQDREEEEIRFALTSEAGLNDGLAKI